jgi:hypothetical protein
VAAAEGAVAAAEDAGGRLETTAARSAGRVAVRRPATGLAAEGGDGEAVEEGAEDDLPFMLAIDGELSRSFAVAGGTITIDVTETSIALLEVVAKEGWQIVTEQIAGREARVVLEDQEGDRATFKAEVAGGRMTIKSALVKHGDGDEDDDDGDDD